MSRWPRLEDHTERIESPRYDEETLTDLSRVFDEQQAAEMRSAVVTADRVDREETAKLGARFE